MDKRLCAGRAAVGGRTRTVYLLCPSESLCVLRRLSSGALEHGEGVRRLRVRRNNVETGGVVVLVRRPSDGAFGGVPCLGTVASYRNFQCQQLRVRGTIATAGGVPSQGEGRGPLSVWRV